MIIYTYSLLTMSAFVVIACALSVSPAATNAAAGRSSSVDNLKAFHDDVSVRDIISDILTRLDEKDKQVLDLQAQNREQKILLNQLNRTLESLIKYTDNLSDKLEHKCAISENGFSDNVNGDPRQLFKDDSSIIRRGFNGRRRHSKGNIDADIQPREAGDTFTSSITPVAFFATLSKEILHSGVNQIIKFDNIVTNIGKSFIPQLGAFVCLRPGVYMFTATLVVERGQDARFQLRKNSSPLSWILVNGKEGTQTVVVVMNKGDTITLINTGIDQSLVGDDYSTFGGYLLYESMPASTFTVVG